MNRIYLFFFLYVCVCVWVCGCVCVCVCSVCSVLHVTGHVCKSRALREVLGE